MQLATPLPIFMVLVKCTVLISVGTMSWRKKLSRTKRCFNQRHDFSSWFGVRAGAANVPPFRSRVGNTATNKKQVFLLKPPDFTFSKTAKIHAENHIDKTPLFRQNIFIQLLIWNNRITNMPLFTLVLNDFLFGFLLYVHCFVVKEA